MSLDLVAGSVKKAMVGAASRDLWQVPLERLHVMPDFNVRADTDQHREHIESLADSIVENGFYQNKPLAGYVSVENGKEKIYVTDGHCRLDAAIIARLRGAAIEALPVVISPKGTNIEDLTVGLITNNSGNPLTEFEIGLVCKRLVGFGWDTGVIAKRIGKSKARVDGLLDLVGADPEIRNMVSAGEVSASQAITTMKKSGAEAAGKLREGVQKAKAKGKKKATAKHIDAKPGYKAVVKALLEWSKASEFVVPDDLKPILKLARESMA